MIDRNKLYHVFKKCWSLESSTKWDKCNPSKGQCSVTALVIYDRFGGSILKTEVNGQWHFYNRIGNQILDLTSEQFSASIDYQDIESSVEEALIDTSQRQYENLKKKFAMHYVKINSKDRTN